MFWLYILKNEETGRYYIGSTGDLNQRITQHLNGRTRTTRVLKIDKLVYTEEYKTIDEVRKRERKLKSYKSRKYIDWLVNKSMGQ